jgi:hypothetical protein
VVLSVLALWALRLGGVIGNWPFVWALISIALLGSVVPYAIDRRRGDAPAAFGMPAVMPAAGPQESSHRPLVLEELATVPPTSSTTAGTAHGT